MPASRSPAYTKENSTYEIWATVLRKLPHATELRTEEGWQALGRALMHPLQWEAVPLPAASGLSLVPHHDISNTRPPPASWQPAPAQPPQDGGEQGMGEEAQPDDGGKEPGGEASDGKPDGVDEKPQLKSPDEEPKPEKPENPASEPQPEREPSSPFGAGMNVEIRGAHLLTGSPTSRLAAALGRLNSEKNEDGHPIAVKKLMVLGRTKHFSEDAACLSADYAGLGYDLEWDMEDLWMLGEMLACACASEMHLLLRPSINAARNGRPVPRAAARAVFVELHKKYSPRHIEGAADMLEGLVKPLPLARIRGYCREAARSAAPPTAPYRRSQAVDVDIIRGKYLEAHEDIDDLLRFLDGLRDYADAELAKPGIAEGA